MSRIAPSGVSAVRPHVMSELSREGKPSIDDRGRSRDSTRWTDGARVPERPNIRQLRSRFQSDDAPKTAPASLGSRASVNTTSGVPEIRLNKTEEHQLSRNTTNSGGPVHMEDPEKYFESTNHTQRFKQTRALFAKMEEQSRLDQERRRQMFHRSKSPTRFPVTSASSLVISPANATGDASWTRLSPTPSTDSDQYSPDVKSSRYGVHEPGTERPRVSSASADIRRDVVSFQQDAAKSSTLPTQTVRSSSVDCLDDDAPYEPSSLQESAKFSSRSETDVGGSIREDVPSPKWLMQHYENVVRKNAALFGGQVTRRRTRPVENHVHSAPYNSREDEGSKPPAASLAGTKVSSAGSQSHVENIPPSLLYNRQNYENRIGAPKVPLTSDNVISRYGRSEYQPSTSLASQKPAQPSNTVVANLVVSKAESKDRGTVEKLGSRSSAKDDDDTVLRSFEAWKTRRLTSSKSEELEKDYEQQTFGDKPSLVTDHCRNSVNNIETHRGSVKESSETESTKSPTSESPVIFGVALRSTALKSEDRGAKSQTELGMEPEPKVTDVEASVGLHSSYLVSVPNPAVDLVGTTAEPDREKFTSLLRSDINRDVDMVETAGYESERRRSLELAEVPHFPKDSVMLTSPRSSVDDSHHPPPPFFHDVKPEDEDSVFMKEHTRPEPSHPQRKEHSSPLASTEPENVGVDMPSADYLPPIEASQ